MPSTSSADPAALDRYRSARHDLSTTVLRAIGRLEQALDEARATAVTVAAVAAPPPLASDVGGRLRRAAIGHQQVGAWAGTVATAFRHADQPSVAGPGGLARRVDAAVLGATLGRLARAQASGDRATATRIAAGLLGGPSAPGPDDVATLAALIEPGVRSALGVSYAGLLGSLDGWPAAERYVINRRAIERARRRATGARAAALDGLLGRDPVTGRPRQFLAFDPGGDGRVVEVLGDLDRADTVALFVPGMSSDLDHFDARIVAKARALHGAATTHGRAPGRDVAVLAWLDYDAPADLPSSQVARWGAAHAGGRDLAQFLDALALGGVGSISVVAHSYGTVVAGDALRRGARADNLLVMGSPGLAVPTRPGRTDLFTMEAPGDLVTDLGRFGPDPNEPDSGFGRLETGGHRHSSYLALGSASLVNAAAVVVDDDGALVRRRPNLGERAAAPVRAMRRALRPPPGLGTVAAISPDPVNTVARAVDAATDAVDLGADVFRAAAG